LIGCHLDLGVDRSALSLGQLRAAPSGVRAVRWALRSAVPSSFFLFFRSEHVPLSLGRLD